MSLNRSWNSSLLVVIQRTSRKATIQSCLISGSSTDYCVKGFNIWLDDWKDRGWRKANKKPVKHRQLWKQVDELRSRKYVEVLKVKAHSGVRGNEIADSLAVDAARSDID